MLDIVLLSFFGVMAYRIFKGLKYESAIFTEFQLPKALSAYVLLYPLGPVTMLFLISFSPLIALITGLACYLPGFLSARKISHSLEIAGTDRVQGASYVVSQAFGTALIGLIYTVGVFLFVVIIKVYFSNDIA